MVLPHHSESSRLPFANDTTQDNEWYPAKFERAIILVVDALRIDYATWSPELDTLSGDHRVKPYHNRLPIIEALNSKSPDQTMLYRFRADPPTTTLQRLKGLTTGQLPTFIDAGSNFAGSAIDEDNWLQALRRRGRNLVFLGDDTWTSLFPAELSDTRALELNDTLWREEGRGWARVRPFPSLNVWDLDTVDDGVFSRLPLFLLPPAPPQAEAADVQAKREKWRGLVRQQEMLAHPDIDAPSESMASAAVSLEQLHGDWDVIIAHGLGVDHCGHRYGPDHAAISAKLAQINEAIELIVDAVNQSERATALYVFGDHGMDPKGDHGGDSPREVDAALWMYANRAWNSEDGRQRSARVVEQASALVRSEPLGAGLDDDLKSGWWANTHLSDDYAHVEPRTLRSIPQIDLVPSLALGLGQPIPFNSLGAVIPELFASDTSPSGEWGLLRALRLNTAQAMRYVDTYVESSRSHGFSDDALSAWRLMYRRAEASYQALREYGPGRQSQMLAEEGVAAEYYAFLRVVLGTLRQMWAQFDAALIVAGLLVLALNAVALAAIYVRARRCSLEAVVARLWRPAAAGGAVGVVLGRALSVVLVAQSASHMSLLEASAAGLAIGVMATSCALLLFATLNDEPSRSGSLWARVCSPAALLNAVAGVLAAMHGLAFVSNSFTFNEDDIVLHLAQTLTLALAALALYSLAPSRSSQQRAAGWRALLCAAVILVLNRAAAYSTVCREEKLLACTPTFYGVPSASISSVRLAAANVAMVWLVPFAVLRVLRRSQSHRAMVARLWAGVGMRVSMGMAAVYWLLDSIDGASGVAAGQKAGWGDLRIVLARLAVGVALGGGLAAWYASPFCLDVALPDAAGVQQGSRRVTVLGYGNAFGAAYLVFVTVVFCVLYLVQQPMGGIMLSLLFVKLLLSIELFDALHDAMGISLVPAQMCLMAMLAYVDYFSTGHQFTLVSIQWSTAFVGVREMHLVVCGAIVALNTLGSFVLAACCVPLAVLWNVSPVGLAPPGRLVARLVGTASLYMGYHGVVAASSAANAAVFRRHLMVWKIFAPRFMFAAPVFLMSIATVLLLATGFAAVRVLRLGINIGLPRDSGRF